jgi:hypothetical protein
MSAMADIEQLTDDELQDIRSVAEALRSGPWDEADLHARHAAALEKVIGVVGAQAQSIADLEQKLAAAEHSKLQEQLRAPVTDEEIKAAWERAGFVEPVGPRAAFQTGYGMGVARCRGVEDT